MLKIAGSINRSFTFPADVESTMSFFADLGRLSAHLPLIDMVKQLGENAYRMLYHAKELGAYNVYLYTDVSFNLMRAERKLSILPIKGYTPVAKKTTFNSSTGQGLYANECLFFPEGENVTRLQYQFELKGQLPRPKGLRFMPASAVNGIANNITHTRMREIADGFVENTRKAFPIWLAEQKSYAV